MAEPSFRICSRHNRSFLLRHSFFVPALRTVGCRSDERWPRRRRFSEQVPGQVPGRVPGQGPEQALGQAQVQGQELAAGERNRWAALASAFAVEGTAFAVEGTAFLASPGHRALVCTIKNIK